MSSNYSAASAFQLICQAANIPTADNPTYDLAEFYKFYPQFQGVIDDAVVIAFAALANATVLQARWHEAWEIGTNLFIAHYCAMYLQTATPQGSDAAAVAAAGQAQGFITSEAAGSVSVSMDHSQIAGNIQGWGDFALTQYGRQYANMARLLGMARGYIY